MPGFRCVAVETATARGSVAACDGGRLVVRTLDNSQTSSREIFRTIAGVLDQLALSPGDLDCIAFGCGPGSFTGVRVAASAAQGLAYAQDLPVCRVSSLEALAATALKVRPAPSIAACLDARMGEAFLGVYALDSSGHLQCELSDMLIDPQRFRLVDDHPGAFAAGAGWEEWPAMLAGHEAGKDSSVWPEAQAVLEIARDMYARGDVLKAYEALPNYVRDKVTM